MTDNGPEIEVIDSEKKIYVVDTSSLVDVPDCIETLTKGGNLVVIPSVVVSELDHLSKKSGDAKYSAREAIKVLHRHRLEKGINRNLESVLRGNENHIKLDNGGALFWETGYSPLDQQQMPHTVNDNIILGCAQIIKKWADGKPYKVGLISEDMDLGLKADVLDINIESLREGKTMMQSPDEIYSGAIDSLNVSSGVIDLFLSGELGSRAINVKEIDGLKDKKLLWNQGVLLVDEENNGRKIPTRYFREGNLLREFRYGASWSDRNGNYGYVSVGGVRPEKDFRQALFFELALDPQIRFLFVYGPAGTGKSTCAAAAAVQLYKASKQRIPGYDGDNFEKIAVMRPEVSSSTTEVAPVPGGMREKTLHWVAPIYNKVVQRGMVAQLPGIQDEQTREKIITVLNTGLLRGLDLESSIGIFDEWQNANRGLNHTAMTRVNESSKVIVLGDLLQIDNRYISWRNSALTLNIEAMKGQHPGIGVVRLDKIYRNPLTKLIGTVQDYRV